MLSSNQSFKTIPMVAKLKVPTLHHRSYPSGLMDQVLGILDSKIQYQEFRINQAVKSYVDIEPLGNPKVADVDKAFSPILENNARVLENIDNASHIIKLLYIIRKALKHENAKLVLNLFSEKRFEKFTAEGLKDYFERPWMTQKISPNINPFTR